MAILDVFKKKREAKGIKEKKKPLEKGKEVVKERIKPEARKPKVKAEISKIAYRVLKAPHVTEKATDLTKKNQYVFKVWPRANKVEIKNAIKSLYGVDVALVRIIKVPRRQRRLGKITGWRKGYKKAIIKVKEGQKIEVLPR